MPAGLAAELSGCSPGPWQGLGNTETTDQIPGTVLATGRQLPLATAESAAQMRSSTAGRVSCNTVLSVWGRVSGSGRPQEGDPPQ